MRLKATQKGRVWGTMRQRLVLLFLLFSFGPLVISNTWGYIQTRQELTRAAGRDVANIAALVASRTVRFVEERKSFVSALGVDQIVITAVSGSTRHSLEPNALQTRTENLEQALAALRQHDSTVLDLAVYSTDGTVWLTAPSDSESQLPPLDRELCQPPSDGSATMAGFEYSGDSEPNLVLTSLIRDDAGIEIGTFCARFQFDIHHYLRTIHDEHAMGASLFILDSDGRVVCGSFPDIHAEPYGELAVEAGNDPVETDGHDDHTHGDDELARGVPIDLASQEALWQGRYISTQADDVLGGFRRIPELGWGVLVEVPVSSALAPLGQLKRQAIVVSGFLAALLLVAIGLTTRSVTRQLSLLGRTAKAIANGALGEVVSPEGPEEIANVAAAFNHMSVSLMELHQNLEERIAERTEALRRSQQFLELLLDSIDQLVVVVDSNNRVVSANRPAKEMYGGDIVGRSYEDAFSALPGTSGEELVQRTIESGRPMRMERAHGVSGTQEIVSFDTYPVLSGESEVESVVQVGRVVTQERRMQAQMVHQEKMAAVGLLAAGVAHEIGNPLAAIHSQLRLTREDPTPDRVDNTLGVVEREVERISRLLRDLVDFSRRKRGTITLVSLEHVVDDIVRLLSHDQRARNIEFRRKIAPAVPGVRTKEDQVLQVLLNLGINALDAMPAGGTLEFEIRHDDEEGIAIKVRDTGTGIPAEARPRLFEPFFTTKAGGRGTGLGLFVSRGIVRDLGGELVVESTGSTGTVFAFHLPLDGNDISSSMSAANG